MQTWMHDMKELDDRPLRELVIPGSHDAGTFVMEHRIDNNSSKCQEISILEQLKAGSRYLDLRAWKAGDGEYWLYHGKALDACKARGRSGGHQDLSRSVDR